MKGMRAEDKVCSLKQAKRLVDLGIELNVCHYWDDKDNLIRRWRIEEPRKNEFPAPDVAELGALLPFTSGLMSNSFKVDALDHTYGGGWRFYVEMSDYYHESGKLYKTEAQARCAALIWLVENGHLKAEDLTP